MRLQGGFFTALACLLMLSFSLNAQTVDCSIPLGSVPTSVKAPERRFAFIVGNSDYQNLPTTPNARHDASDLANALAPLGFDVTCGINLNRQQFIDRLNAFRSRLDAAGPNAVSLFYYAGHGVQIDSNNYLIPIGAKVRNPETFETEAINLTTVMHLLINAENRHGSKFIILDACRDNPLGKGWGKPRAGFSIKGLNWTFGTGYGDVAYDGGGRNGLFTKHLLQKLNTRGATYEQVMKSVVAAVDHESEGGQVPEMGGSSIRDFMFVPGKRISIQTVYEDTPLWLKLIYWLALVMVAILGWFYYRHRQKTAWVRGVDLTAKLNIDKKVADDIRRKTRLANDKIVGYVKQVKDNRLAGLMTPDYEMVLGRNNNVNIVLDSDSVSGEHARIGWDAEKKSFWLEDLGSTNGTWWRKGKRLEPNKRYPLESGQLFYLADQNTPMVVIAHADAD